MKSGEPSLSEDPPYAKLSGRPLIVCGDLVRAVKRESSIAVSHAFGVSVSLVKLWRRALDVPRNNEGSQQLFHRVAKDRTDDRMERARKSSKLPAALANLSAALKGRIQSPATIKAVRRAAMRPKSEAWKKNMSAYWRQRGHPPGHPEIKFWAEEEVSLLGTDADADAEIARRIGRSQQAVSDRRVKLKIMSFRERRQLAKH